MTAAFADIVVGAVAIVAFAAVEGKRKAIGAAAFEFEGLRARSCWSAFAIDAYGKAGDR